MKFFQKIVWGACLTICVPLFAKASTCECTIKSFSRTGWVPETLYLAIDKDENVGAAYDYYIHTVHGTPIPVDLEKEGDARYKFNWHLNGVPMKGNERGVVSYTVRLNEKSRSLTLKAILHGYDNEIRGQGKCKLAE